MWEMPSIVWDRFERALFFFSFKRSKTFEKISFWFFDILNWFRENIEEVAGEMYKNKYEIGNQLQLAESCSIKFWQGYPGHQIGENF